MSRNVTDSDDRFTFWGHSALYFEVKQFSQNAIARAAVKLLTESV